MEVTVSGPIEMDGSLHSRASAHTARTAAVVLFVSLATGVWSCRDGARGVLRVADEAEIAGLSQFDAQILNGRYDAQTQILTLDVWFICDTPQHVVFSGAAFLSQPRRPVGIDVIVDDGTLTIDLSRRHRAPPPTLTSEGPNGMRLTESFQAFCGTCRPAGGIVTLTYLFRFPIYGAMWGSKTFVCERPQGRVPVRLRFGYGSVAPYEYERTHPRKSMHELDQEMLDVWQRCFTTAPVTVDFGHD